MRLSEDLVCLLNMEKCPLPLLLQPVFSDMASPRATATRGGTVGSRHLTSVLGHGGQEGDVAVTPEIHVCSASVLPCGRVGSGANQVLRRSPVSLTLKLLSATPKATFATQLCAPS